MGKGCYKGEIGKVKGDCEIISVRFSFVEGESCSITVFDRRDGEIVVNIGDEIINHIQGVEKMTRIHEIGKSYFGDFIAKSETRILFRLWNATSPTA